MASDSGERKLSGLRAASRDADAASVARIWRELTPREQEDVVFTLLGMQADVNSEVMPPEPDEAPDLATSRGAETAALEPVEQTVLTPKLVEDLQGMSGSENGRPNDVQSSPTAPTGPTGPTEYRSRWLQRWKWSMLVAAWAVTTSFAFTANVSAFGPMEWFVAIAASVLGGGLLVGTLLNCAVAAIPLRAPISESTQRD